MPISFVLESLDSVEEAHKSLYVQKEDGKFHLDGDDTIKDHALVGNLVRANQRNKDDLAAVRAKLAEAEALAKDFPDDFDAEKWAKLKDGKPDEAALIELRKSLETERDEWKGKFETAHATSLANALDRDLTDALNEAGVTNPTFAKAARGMLSNGVKIGDDGKPFVDSDMGPLALTDHVKRWAAGEGKDFVTPAIGGGGKGGNGGKGSNALIDKVPALADLPVS